MNISIFGGQVLMVLACMSLNLYLYLYCHLHEIWHQLCEIYIKKYKKLISEIYKDIESKVRARVQSSEREFKIRARVQNSSKIRARVQNSSKIWARVQNSSKSKIWARVQDLSKSSRFEQEFKIRARSNSKL
jgi:hypothetical protein